MLGSIYRATRRSIAGLFHKDKEWNREERLSIAGVFDFALNSRTKREALKSMSTTSYGTRKRFSRGKSESIQSIVWNVYFRDYMNEYWDGEDSFESRQTAIRNYLLENTLPELVECNVVELHIKLEDETDVYVDNIEELLSMGILEGYETNYQEPSDFQYNFDNEKEIMGVYPGDRFEYAVEALRSVHKNDKDHEFFEDYI